MIASTAGRLHCPARRGKSACGGNLELLAPGAPRVNDTLDTGTVEVEVRSGELECRKCRTRYPILGGVAVLVPDVRRYVHEHIKGIARVVDEEDVPRALLKDFRSALSSLRRQEEEGFEEDLEADRVVALYVMNHYLSASPVLGEDDKGRAWWAPRFGSASALIEGLVLEYWDRGPHRTIEDWVRKLSEAKGRARLEVVELGCGVAGLARRLGGLRPAILGSYLGVDSSFASVALGRHLALGLPYPDRIRIPEDLLAGPLPRELRLPAPEASEAAMDLVVGDLTASPLRPAASDIVLALNAIDMMDEPASLPRLQRALLRPGGIAISSCPYIWHEQVARALRRRIPAELRSNSARAVEWLYAREGLETGLSVDHLPWLFFKHARQLEVYSVHVFQAIRREGNGS